MKKFELLFFSLFFCLMFGRSIHAQAPTAAWINEFHYDNAGADVGEFVEIVVNQSFADPSNLKISFYRADGTVYTSRLLSSFTTGTTQDGFTIYSKSITIQNGPNQGFALDYSGTLISGQFLSYEGTFTATEGPANGLTSTDNGITEGGSTLVGNSLYLTGTSTQYSDFTWTSGTATAGTVNGSQSLPVELSSFSAVIVNSGIKLNWRTETELNNYGFEVERKVISEQLTVGNWKKIAFLEGFGNSNSPKNYSFIDREINYGNFAYRLKQIDNDGSYEYSDVIEVNAGIIPEGFVLEQNYPNPFNPTTSIKFALAETQLVELKVFDVLGNEVATLFSGLADGGKVYETEFDAANLSSGIYFYKLETRNFLLVKKMSLIR